MQKDLHFNRTSQLNPGANPKTFNLHQQRQRSSRLESF
jgi:hypothetical protein